ncbi:hypothetical protein CLV35_2866 [Motilibacter peucedani]|uniref:CU044_5270 family protein n=1 Tax=Motilibacter peucedani TaxID=598650 RepID=A0A420XMX0_9ACTN|nr:CU044_5270 family protein [Motilibacter peucedani]RKS72619.1 hypothetical protein CLV35_2866 [Motilibacter peucedani]
MTTQTALDRLAAQRPVPALPDVHARQRLLTEVLARPQEPAVVPPLRSRPRGRTLLAGGLVAAAVAAAVVVPATFPGSSAPTTAAAYAATPPVLAFSGERGTDERAGSLLRELAEVAARQPAPTGAGRFSFVESRGWYLDLELHSDGTTTGGVDPVLRRSWIASDGSGRAEETRAGAELRDDYGPGGLSGPQELSTDVPTLARQLREEGGFYGTPSWLDAVAEVWKRQVVTPGVQAAMLRVLALQQDLVVLGDGTDRLGRPGVALATESDYSGLRTRYVLVVSRSTGALLDFEQVALEAGRMPVRAPATTSYTAWVRSGFTSTTHQEP